MINSKIGNLNENQVKSLGVTNMKVILKVMVKSNLS